jgi:acetyl esterase
MAVGGDSAGGNLAAVVALMARDRGGPSLRYQLLIYPLTDFKDHSPSMREYGENHFLSHAVMGWFADSYVPSAEERRTPYASPWYADLAGLPAAMVITGECDPLRDQGEAFARKLQNAGVAVVLKRYDGMIHPFFSLAAIIDTARVAIADAAAAVRQALTARTPAGV